jgi:acyl-CoA thioesterase-2
MDLGELLDVLDLRPLNGAAAAGARRYEGRSPHGRARAVFGGQFLAQALLAAGRSVPAGRPPHSLHAYFLRSGDPAVPILYDVEPLRDGRSFSHRQVRATQDGRDVLRLVASFQERPPGSHRSSRAEHDDPVPVSGVDPSTLARYEAWALAGTDNPDHDVYTEPSPVDIRYEDPQPAGFGQVVRGGQRLWMRLAGNVPGEDPLLHAALLAWMSDKTIADFSTLAHGHRWTDVGANSLSLDHAMWFVRPARADRWVLFAQEAATSTAGRALTRGDMATPEGTRVAVVNQEVLLTLPDA